MMSCLPLKTYAGAIIQTKSLPSSKKPTASLKTSIRRKSILLSFRHMRWLSCRTFALPAVSGAVLAAPDVWAPSAGRPVHVEPVRPGGMDTTRRPPESAQRAGVELLPWRCETGQTVAGGIKQAFRLKPLVKAIRAAYGSPDLTWGSFLNQLQAEVDITFSFDAVKLPGCERFTALVRNQQGPAKVDDQRLVYFPESMRPSPSQQWDVILMPALP
jgi:hypothetical protein